jgi:hypothetical protein
MYILFVSWNLFTVAVESTAIRSDIRQNTEYQDNPIEANNTTGVNDKVHQDCPGDKKPRQE